MKSTDISLDRQASSASVIRFEKLSRYHEHQLSWRKLLKIIILNFILYIIQVYCTLIYKQYEHNEKMLWVFGHCRMNIIYIPYFVGIYKINLHSLRNRTEKLSSDSLFYPFIMFVQINLTFADNVCRLFIYTCTYTFVSGLWLTCQLRELIDIQHVFTIK